MENVCDTCHSQTNHHQSDGTAPGGQSHNDSSDCMVCHAHIDAFIPAGPDAPHDTQPFLDNCDYCHVSPTDFTTKIPDSQCEQCHTAGGALKGSFPAAPNVLTHSDANNPGSSYTYTNDCVDCHNPMAPQLNLVHIRTDLSAAGGGTNVVFTAYSGTDSFADGAPYAENICNTCHTQTNHHQNDGTAPGGQDHNNSADCGACHAHLDAFIPSGECIGCHNDPNLPVTATYVERDVVGSDFTQASRHVFGGTVSNWDCIVCHREGDSTAATSGDVATTSLHNNAGGIVVDMRNVDSQNTGWTWDKNATDDAMHSDMDTFCMSCHDSNGASAIAVRSDDAGITLTPTLDERTRPFNSSDEPSVGTLGGTVDMAGYERTGVLNVFTQFDPNNPSHHAVRAPAYSSHNSNWGAGAWVANSLKSGQELTTVFEAAQLHCADCHTVDSADGGAHGGANGFMLQAASIDGTCYLCHNSNVYSNNSSTLTRWSHDNEPAVWNTDKGALIGGYGGVVGSICLNCHGGNPVTDGFGGIHGLPSGTDPRSGQERYRFQGGAYMSHDPGSWDTTGGSATCYFAGSKNQDWSACTQHSGNLNSRTASPQYDRGLPGSY